MTPGDDDDALSWAGDDDPTLAPSLPEGYKAVGRGADAVAQADGPASASEPKPQGPPSPDSAPAPGGNAALIAYGVLGGVYLLWTIGWIVGGLRLQGTAQFLVSGVAYQVALWLAVLAAPIWFGVTVLFTRASRTWVRFVWLAVGAALLVPWPFVMVGAVGQ